MGFKYKSPEMPKQKQEALDEKWYARFEQVASFEDFAYLEGEKTYRDKEKAKFIEGTHENPSLDYPKLKNFDFTQKETALLSLKKDILEGEANEVVRQVYRWKINEKLAELRMLQATFQGNDRRFSKYSNFIYGKPEEQIYEYTMFQVKNIIDSKLFSDNTEVTVAAQRLHRELFQALMENDNSIDPKNFEMPAIKSLKGEEDFNAEEIKEAFEEVLLENKIFDWKIVVDENGSSTAIRVIQEDKEVKIPKTRTLKKTSLEALIKHEIETHVLRRETGSRSKLHLLGLGLDRYTKGEEGVATYKEQLVKGTAEFSGFDGHFAIALAVGIDGKKRTFREVFNILKDYYFIKSSKTKDDAEKSAADSAWSRCVRTFRGTTCQTPGACFTKDMVYREGNIGIWNVVKNNPDEIRRFSVGKYDPTNPRHIWILEQLGIEDEDLEAIER